MSENTEVKQESKPLIKKDEDDQDSRRFAWNLLPNLAVLKNVDVKSDVKPLKDEKTDPIAVCKKFTEEKDEKPIINTPGKDKSMRKYMIPSGKFTLKTQEAETAMINLKLCDPMGHTWEFNVSNKDALYQSVIKPFIRRANLNRNVSEPLIKQKIQ